MLGEVADQLSGDPIVAGEPPPRRCEIAQQALAGPSDGCRFQGWRGRGGLVPIAVSSDSIVAAIAATLEPGRKMGAADPLEVALSLARAAKEVEGVGGGRPLDGPLRASRRPVKREQRDTETGE
jgi:hypothetical protein